MPRKHEKRVNILKFHPVVQNGPPLVQVYTEECLRISTCQGCDTPVVKGERRLVIESWHHTRQRRERAYFHIRCMVDLMQATETQKKGVRACCDCGTDMPTNREYDDFDAPKDPKDKAETQRIIWAAVGAGERKYTAYLCSDCASTPKWEHCEFCGLHNRRKDITWVVEGKPKIICTTCAKRLEYKTRRDVLQEAAQDRKFRRIQKKLQEEVDGS